MKSVILPVVLFFCSIPTPAQGGQPNSEKAMPPQAMCNAAAPALRDAGTNEVVLTMTVDAKGRVRSFTTDSPKGLRLEKIKEATAAIKALQFKPAKKDGRAVAVMVRVKFDCSRPATDASKEQQPH
jgi:TonB family protein